MSPLVEWVVFGFFVFLSFQKSGLCFSWKWNRLVPQTLFRLYKGGQSTANFHNRRYGYRRGGAMWANSESIQQAATFYRESTPNVSENEKRLNKSWKDMMYQGLSVDQAQQVFDELVASDQFRECLHFIQLSSDLGHNLNQIKFHELLKQARTLTRAKELVRRLESVGVVINSMGYTLILMAMEKERNLQDMVDLLEFMRLVGSPPNEVSYGVTINTASHLCDGVFATHLLHDMILHGVNPSPPCYSGVLMACAKANMWDDVQKLLTEMVQQGNEVSEGMLIGLLFQIKSKVQNIKDDAKWSTRPQESGKLMINGLWKEAWRLLDHFLGRVRNLSDYVFVVAMEIADLCDRPYDIYHVYELMELHNIPVGKATRQWLEQACFRTKDHNLALHILHHPHFDDPRSTFLNMTMHLCSEVGDHFQTISLIRQRLDFLRHQEEAHYFHRFSGPEFGLFADAIDNITSAFPFLLDPNRPALNLIENALSVYYDHECRRMQEYWKDHIALFRRSSRNVTLDDLARVTVFYDEMELGNDMTEDSQLFLMRIALESNRWTALRRMTERFAHRDYVEFMTFNQTRLFEMAGVYSCAHPNVDEYLRFNAYLIELLNHHGEARLASLLFLQSMERFQHPRDWLGHDMGVAMDNMSCFVETVHETRQASTSEKESGANSIWSAYTWYLVQTQRLLSKSPLTMHAYRCAALGFLRDGYPGYALALRDTMRQHQVEDAITDRLILLALLNQPSFLPSIIELLTNDTSMHKDPVAFVLGIDAIRHLTSSPDIYETAIVYLRNLSSLGYPITTEIINEVIAICVACQRPEEAKRLMQTMEVFDIPRNNATYHLVAESLIKANMWNDVRGMMQSSIQNPDQFPLEPWVRSLYAKTTNADLFESEFSLYRDYSSPDSLVRRKFGKESLSTKAKLPPAKGFGRKPLAKKVRSANPFDGKSDEVEPQDIRTVNANELCTTTDWDLAIRRHLVYQRNKCTTLSESTTSPHPNRLYFESLVDSLRAQGLHDHLETLAAMYVLLGIVRRTSLLLGNEGSSSLSNDESQRRTSLNNSPEESNCHVDDSPLSASSADPLTSPPAVLESVVSYLQQQLRTKS